MEIDVTKKILNFKDLLCDIAPTINNLMATHEWGTTLIVEDWIDINWELLIGKNLLGDKHNIATLVGPNPHWKYLSIQSRSDYAIIGFAKNSELKDPLKNKIIPIEKGLRFTGFVSVYENRGYGFYPPFNIASLFDEKTRQFFYAKIEELQFYIMPYEEYLNQLFYPETPRPGLI